MRKYKFFGEEGGVGVPVSKSVLGSLDLRQKQFLLEPFGDSSRELTTLLRIS